MASSNPNLRDLFYRTTDDSGEQLVWVPMTPQERSFAKLCQRILDEGRIPGPTELNAALGRGKDNNLHGNFSKIRRSIFVGAGLVKDVSRDRWVRPSAPAR